MNKIDKYFYIKTRKPVCPHLEVYLVKTSKINFLRK